MFVDVYQDYEPYQVWKTASDWMFKYIAYVPGTKTAFFSNNENLANVLAVNIIPDETLFQFFIHDEMNPKEYLSIYKTLCKELKIYDGDIPF